MKPGTNGTVLQVHGDSDYAVAHGKSVRLEFPEPIVTVDDFDPQVIQVIAESSQRLKVTGNEAGLTSIRIHCESDQAEATYVLGMRVDAWESSHEELAGILKDLYPHADIKLVAIRDSILLRGTVSNLAEAKQISEIAEQYAPKVINQLRLKEDSAATRKHMVMLKFADADKVRSLSVGDRVDLIRGREVRDGRAVEFEEKIVAHDAEVEKVHISGSFALLGVRVTPLESHVLSETDSRELTVVRKEGSAGDADGFPQHDSLSPRSQIEIPQGMRIAVVKNLKADVVRSLSPGPRGHSAALTVRRVVTEVTDAGKVSREVAETFVQQLAAGVEVVSVDADTGSVGLVVTAEVAATLAERFRVDDLTLQPSGDSSPNIPGAPRRLRRRPITPVNRRPTPPATRRPTLRSRRPTPGRREDLRQSRRPTPRRRQDYPADPQTDAGEQPDSADADQPAKSITLSSECVVALNPVENSTSKPAPTAMRITRGSIASKSNHPSIRSIPTFGALHDDVRKLIGLLERRLSQGNHDEHEFSLPAKTFSPEEKTFAPETKTYSADEVPYESKPQPLEEAGGKTAPGDDAAPQSEAKPQGSDDPAASAFNEQVWQRLGLRVSQLKSDAQQLRGQPYHGGLLIEAVRPDGPANKAGLRVGDALVGLHVWETVSPEDLHYVLNHPEAVESRPVKFYVLRNGEVLYGHVEFDWLQHPKPDVVNAADAPSELSPQMTNSVPLQSRASDPERELEQRLTLQRHFVNEWGRAMLQGKYAEALALVERCRQSDPENSAYDYARGESLAAVKTGVWTNPLLVAVTARWSAPSQRMEPTYKRLLVRPTPIVIFDADHEDSILKQLQVGSFPALISTVGGKKIAELTGVHSDAEIDAFYNQHRHRPELQ
ncbi:MAG: PDZ domain-containing protein [Planctomycetaceae bacterium]